MIRVLLLWLCLAAPALAVQPDEVLPDAALEARARALSRELRCVQCQSESIDDSNASIARDLRILVRERLLAGDTDDEVLAYLVERYGEFVLLNPPVQGANWLLWLAGPAMLVMGGAVFVATTRRRMPETVGLTEAEQARLRELTGD
jgi:cytochrome c-type biogenesis protein CcmH